MITQGTPRKSVGWGGMRTLLASTLALLLAGPLSGPAAAQNVVTSGGIPLTAALQANALQAHVRILILPGTPNPPVQGTLAVGSSPSETLARLLELNGLVAHQHDGVLIVGTPQAMDARFGSSTARAELVPVVGLDPSVVAQSLLPQLPAGTVLLADQSRHALYVSGTPLALQQVKAFVAPLLQADESVVRIPLHSGADPVKVAGLLQKLAPPILPESVAVDPSGDAVLVAGPLAYQNQVRQVLAYIDVDAPQVKYEVAIIEVDPVQLQHNIGLMIGQSQTNYSAVGTTAIGQLSSPSNGQAIFGFPINRTLSLNGELDLLVSHGSARLIQRNEMTVANGQSGAAGFTEEVPYQVTTQNGFAVTTSSEYKTVGLTINLSPQIGDSTIGTEAKLVYSTISGTGVTGAPEIASRSQTTRVTTADGQTFVVGGLNSESFSSTKQGIPLLSSLPIIGGLFTHTQDQLEKQELVMVISAERVGTSKAFDPSKYPAIKPYMTPQPEASPR